MLETILLALLIGKIKGYKLKPLFKEWVIYPILIFELVYLYLEVSVFAGNYSFIKYVSILKTLYICSYLFLIINYKLYASAIIGSLFVFLGSTCNNIAMRANDGKMPVFPTLSYLTRYIKRGDFLKVGDFHVLGNTSTKYKFLTDIIDTGYCIMSVGDIFIRFFVFIIIFSSIKHINKARMKNVDD